MGEWMKISKVRENKTDGLREKDKMVRALEVVAMHAHQMNGWLKK